MSGYKKDREKTAEEIQAERGEGLKAYQRQAETFKADIKAAKDELYALNRKILKAQDEIQSEEARLKSITEEAEKSRRALIADLEKKIADLQNQSSTFWQELKAKQDAADSRMAEADSIIAGAAKIEQEYKAALGKLAKDQEKLAAERADVVRIQNEFTLEKESNEQALAEIKEIQKGVENKRVAAQEMLAQIDIQLAQIEKAKSESAAAEQSAKDAAAQLSTLQEMKRGLDAKSEALRLREADLDQKEDDIKSLINQSKVIENSAKKLMEEAKRRMDAARQLEASLNQ